MKNEAGTVVIFERSADEASSNSKKRDRKCSFSNHALFCLKCVVYRNVIST